MIGNNIKKIRNLKKLTQKEVAKRAGMYWTMYCKIEQNVSKEPTIQSIEKIADALETSIDNLIGRKFPKK